MNHEMIMIMIMMNTARNACLYFKNYNTIYMKVYN